MSLLSNYNQTCDVYRMTKRVTFSGADVWAALVLGVPCARTSSSRRVVLQDGSVQLLNTETVMLDPRDVIEADRLVIDSVVYKIDAVIDVADLGREYRLAVSRLPVGTATEMGVG